MKTVKSIFRLKPVFIVLSLFISLLSSFSAHAAVDGWIAGNIMDDGIFTNSSTMTPGQIQVFLESKVPSCDTNGQQLSEYGGPDLNGDGKVQRWEWGKSKYNQTTFYCLRDAWENGRNASRIIWDTAQKYSINPQVLIVLLQKEQGLITDTWPLSIQYKTATGYGCPDTAPCDSQYYGLTNQLDWAAKMFRAIMNDSPTWYTPYELGDNYIRYNPDASCGGSNVKIQNRATQALYNYTPYQPNQGALNAGWGTANCGAYGNRNFYLYFNNWFGDTRIQILASIAERYAELGGSSGVLGPVTMNRVCNLRNGGCYQGFQNGGIYWSSASGTFESYGDLRQRYLEMNTENGALGYPTSAVICGLKSSGCYQSYQNGALYYSPTVGHAYESISNLRDRYWSLGSENGPLGYPSTPVVCGLRNGGCYQGYENGAIYKSSLGTYENYGAIRQYYLQNGTENGGLGYPISSQSCNTRDNGCYQFFEKGSVYQTTNTGTHSILSGISTKWSQFSKEWGVLGFPLSDETYGAKNNSSYQTFQGGTIYWTSRGGIVIFNQIADRWRELGSEWGMLDYPISDTICGTKNNGCYQLFNNTRTIYWSPATGAKTVWGGIYNAWSKVGKEWGRLGYPLTNEIYVDGGSYQDFEGGTIHWNSAQGTTVTYN